MSRPSGSSHNPPDPPQKSTQPLQVSPISQVSLDLPWVSLSNSHTQNASPCTPQGPTSPLQTISYPTIVQPCPPQIISNEIKHLKEEFQKLKEELAKRSIGVGQTNIIQEDTRPTCDKNIPKICFSQSARKERVKFMMQASMVSTSTHGMRSMKLKINASQRIIHQVNFKKSMTQENTVCTSALRMNSMKLKIDTDQRALQQVRFKKFMTQVNMVNI